MLQEEVVPIQEEEYLNIGVKTKLPKGEKMAKGCVMQMGMLLERLI